MPEQLQDLPFPSKGLDFTAGFGAQRPGTTSVGTNVRTFEPGTQRSRGGSRPGLSKYVLPQLPTAGKIQCLDYIVDPSADAILASFGNGGFNDPGVLDPSTNPSGSSPGDGRFRNNGNVWRTGGSGIQPNRNVALTLNNPYHGTVVSDPASAKGDGVDTSVITVTVEDRYNFPVEGDTITLSTSPSGRVGDGTTAQTDGFGQVAISVTNTNPETVTYSARDTTKGFTVGSATVNWGSWQYIQGNSQIYINSPTFFTSTISYPSDVTAGNLLFVGCSAGTGAQASMTVTDSLGNVWTLLTTNAGNIVRTFAAVARSSGPCTVTITTSFNQNVVASGVLEYSGNSASPIDSTQTNSGAATTAWNSASVALSSSKGLVVAFYTNLAALGTFGTFSAADPYNLRTGAVTNNPGLFPFDSFTIQLADNINVTTTPADVEITSSTPANYIAHTASFK